MMHDKDIMHKAWMQSFDPVLQRLRSPEGPMQTIRDAHCFVMTY